MKTEGIKRVNITLPIKTLQKVDRIAKRGNRSQLIDRAVNFYVQEVGRKNLREILKQGALDRATRDKDTAAEWFTLGEKTWRGRTR